MNKTKIGLIILAVVLRLMVSGLLFHPDVKTYNFQASFLSRTIDPEKSVVQNDVVSQVLDKLTAQQKSALVLRECHGFKYAEISDILGINNNALKQLLIRARRSFRRQYTQMYPPSEG